MAVDMEDTETRNLSLCPSPQENKNKLGPEKYLIGVWMFCMYEFWVLFLAQCDLLNTIRSDP